MGCRQFGGDVAVPLGVQRALIGELLECLACRLSGYSAGGVGNKRTRLGHARFCILELAAERRYVGYVCFIDGHLPLNVGDIACECVAFGFGPIFEGVVLVDFEHLREQISSFCGCESGERICLTLTQIRRIAENFVGHPDNIIGYFGLGVADCSTGERIPACPFDVGRLVQLQSAPTTGAFGERTIDAIDHVIDRKDEFDRHAFCATVHDFGTAESCFAPERPMNGFEE